jgi:hypothetical protein
MILQDLRRGLPPASVPPHHVWPSHRIWEIVSGLWSLDPLSRSSALTAGQVLELAEFTLPPNVIQRVVAFVDANYIGHHNIGPATPDLDMWTTRTRCLYNLCLVSREYCGWGTPALYRILWFHEDVKAAALFALDYSLKNSVIYPLACNRAAGGYGGYTESVFIGRIRNQDLRGGLSTLFRDLLQRTPRLRLVYLGDGAVPRPLHPLSTLSIDYTLESIFIVDESIIFTAFSHLQRLHIECIYPPMPPSFPAASSRLFFPHLRVLEIGVGVLAEYESPSSLLEALSGWKMPSLQYLDIASIGETKYADALVGFLRSHGAVLRYVTLRYYNSGCAMSQDVFTTIFTLCTNLRSMNVSLANTPAFDLLPAHLNLEKLCITLDNEYEHAEIYETLKNFKSITSTSFPKLLEAKFMRLSRYPKLTAFFRTGDEFITLVDGIRVSRYYDGGSVEIGKLLCSASGML